MNERSIDSPIGAPGDVILVLFDSYPQNMNVCYLHSYMATILLTHVKESISICTTS